MATFRISMCLFILGFSSETVGQSSTCTVGTYWNGVTCQQCPAGETTQTTGATSESMCYESCNIGYHFHINTEVCTLCDQGYYQDTVGKVTCEACGVGQTTLSTGSTSQTQCFADCRAGTKLDTVNNACVDCPIGTYQDLDRQTTCKSCGVNYRTEQKASTNQTQCIFYCENGREAVGTVCRLCPVTKYRSNEVDNYYSSCRNCPSNYRTLSTGSSFSSQCSIYRCPAGSKPNANNNGCDLCPLGYYQNLADQLNCIQCDPGLISTRTTGAILSTQCESYCPSGEEKGAGGCTDCVTGTYKDNSISFFHMCTSCAEPYTTAGTRSTSVNACTITDCLSGYEPGTTSGTCVACAIGFYRTDNDQDRCTPCPQEFITPSLASVSINDCTVVDCGLGYRRDVNTNTCVACPIGWYQDTVRLTTCKQCGNPIDRYRTDQEASTSQSDCRYFCQSGYQLVGTTSCQQCPIATYRNNVDHGYYSSCQNCPSQKSTQNPGATTLIQCSLYRCSIGEKANADNTGCTPCPRGEYQDYPDQTVCFACGSGLSTTTIGSTSQTQCIKYCPSGQYVGANNNCIPCDIGYYKNNTINIFSTCTKCPDHYLTSGVGSTSEYDCNIRDCAAGSKTRSDGTGCDLCPIGTYQPEPRKTVCLNCPSSTHTRLVGSTQCEAYCPSGQEKVGSQCISCPRGQFKDNNENLYAVCTVCPDSNYVTSGTGSTSSQACTFPNCQAGSYITNNQCEFCPRGTYQPVKWQTGCISCISDRTTSTTGATHISECTLSCDPGFGAIDGNCVACQIGFYKSQFGATLCTACPARTRTATTQSTSQAQCSIVGCDPGNYLATSNTCLPCAVDTYQDEKWKNSCKNCDADRQTFTTGSADPDQCVRKCANGYELHFDLQCHACEQGYFKREPLRQCVPCTNGLTTRGTGAIRDADCVLSPCQPGQFFNLKQNFKECQPCPKNYYQPDAGTFSCLECGYGSKTAGQGSTSASACISNCDVTNLNTCSSHATCSISVSSGMTCTCNAGYDGDGTTCTHFCETQNYCNGGVCTAGSSTICQCDENHFGNICQFQRDSRASSSNMNEIIIGVVIGALILVVTVLILLVCCWRHCGKQRPEGRYESGSKYQEEPRRYNRPTDMKNSRPPSIVEVYQPGRNVYRV